MNNGFQLKTPKDSRPNQQPTVVGGAKQGKPKKKKVIVNRSGNFLNSKSMPTTPQTHANPIKFPQQYQHSGQSAQSSINYFGPLIPEDVMENVLFRFLYNIPENEKEDQIRICFHLELAHWFYLDFYCPDNSEPPVPNCKKLGFPQFARQVFNKCEYLEKWRTSVDKVVEYFRQYKSSVPTYGVIMLDATLNYILLVQGYYASKNSWGFPKGKINEGELPLECAIREAYEEVGFDAKDHISDKIRPLQSFIGETLIRLYLATDVPMDHAFRPHLRKEIRKISWFSVWDLPKDRNDDQGCARLGLQPNNFYSVLPFMTSICNFIQRERGERNKPKCSALNDGKYENSAFQPVIPRASSNQQLSVLTPNSSTQNLLQITPHQQQQQHPISSSPTTSKKSAVENLFKPLNVDPDPAPPQSFTGQSFLEQFIKTATSPGGAGITAKENSSNNREQQIPKNPAGIIGSESRRRNKEIKQPKPLNPSKLIVNVYEAPPEQQSSPESAQKQKKGKTAMAIVGAEMPAEQKQQQQQTPQPAPSAQQQTKATTEMGEEGGNEIVNMLRSSIGKKEQLPKQTTSKKKTTPTALKVTTVAETTARPQLVPTQVRLCEAWKKFTFDKTCFRQIAAATLPPTSS